MSEESTQAEGEPGGQPRGPRERVLWNTVAITLARNLSDILHVVAALKIVRHLVTKQWGLYSYLHSSLDLFRVLANFGLNLVTVRVLAVNALAPRTVATHMMLIKTALVTLAVGIVLLICLGVERWAENLGLLMLLALGLYPTAYTGALEVRFQAEHKTDRLIISKVLSGATYVGAVYLLTVYGIQVPGLVALFVAYKVWDWVLSWVIYRWTWPEDPRVFDLSCLDRQTARDMFMQALPVGILMVEVIIYMRLGVFLLERYQGIEAVGKYYMAIRITEPLLGIGAALSTSAFPVLSRLVEARRAGELRRRFLRYSGRSAIFSCAIAGIMTLFAREILHLIKPEYVDASGALIALAWGTVFMFQNQVSASITNSFGKYHYITIISFFNLLIYTGFSFTLIPRLGTTGAGLATAATEGINMVVQFIVAAWLIRRAARSGGQPT